MVKIKTQSRLTIKHHEHLEGGDDLTALCERKLAEARKDPASIGQLVQIKPDGSITIRAFHLDQNFPVEAVKCLRRSLGDAIKSAEELF